jgi:hypothetical protein
MKEEEQSQLIEQAQSSIEKIQFKDGTLYYRMPNGNLVRSTPRPHKLRKALKEINKK